MIFFYFKRQCWRRKFLVLCLGGGIRKAKSFMSNLPNFLWFKYLFLVVGNRFGNLAETTVSAGEIAEFEQNWNIPVVCVRNQTNSSNPGSITEVLGIGEPSYRMGTRRKILDLVEMVLRRLFFSIWYGASRIPNKNCSITQGK